MRQAWAQTAAITPSGAVDEFYRKKARNDYVLAALWETGIRKLRVPMDDLLDPEARKRLGVLEALGHETLLFCYEAPPGEAAAVLTDHVELFSALEVIVPSHRTADVLPDTVDLGSRAGLPVYLSRLRSSAEAICIIFLLALVSLQHPHG